MTAETVTIPARRGKAARVRKGQRITIISTHGTQVVDTWAFSAEDPTEWMSMEASRAWFLKLAAAVGDSFVTNRRRPILTLVEDTSGGAHDMLMAACDRERYGLLGVKGHHDNCRDNLHAALKELGVTIPATPSPLNVFMNIPWTADGTLSWGEPVSPPGSYARLPRRDGPDRRLLGLPPGHPAHQWPDRGDDRGPLHDRVSFATASSTTVPLKKSGLSAVCSFTGLAKTNSLKSDSEIMPCSTSSHASSSTSDMSSTSKWPTSELKIGLSRWWPCLSKAQAVIGSSASQPK